MKIAVIGAGNGGQALAAYLAHRGHEVSLYNRSRKRILPIIRQRTLILEVEGKKIFSRLSYAGTEIDKVIKGKKLIMVVLPAFAHAPIAEKMAESLEDGQIIVLNPGRTGGAIEFYNILRKKGIKRDIIIAETQTFIFASRIINPGMAKIFKIKNSVPISALPSAKNKELEKVIQEVMPEFEIAPNILYTSFDNFGAVFHPAGLILNTGWVESTYGNFQFYLEGISPSVAKILEKIDEERCEVARKLKIEPMRAVEWLDYAYDVQGDNLYEAIHSNIGYQGIKAPPSMKNRYIIEDVPMSLVPISSFGKHIGVKTPTINAIVTIASAMMGKNFWETGRTIEKLGLSNMKIEDIWKFIEQGDNL